MTFENFPSIAPRLAEQIMPLPIQGEGGTDARFASDHGRVIVQASWEKALYEVNFAQLYCALWHKLSEAETEWLQSNQLGHQRTRSHVRRWLAERAQSDFTRLVDDLNKCPLRSLKELCGQCLEDNGLLGKRGPDGIDDLPLPEELREFLRQRCARRLECELEEAKRAGSSEDDLREFREKQTRKRIAWAIVMGTAVASGLFPERLATVATACLLRSVELMQRRQSLPPGYDVDPELTRRQLADFVEMVCNLVRPPMPRLRGRDAPLEGSPAEASTKKGDTQEEWRLKSIPAAILDQLRSLSQDRNIPSRLRFLLSDTLDERGRTQPTNE